MIDIKKPSNCPHCQAIGKFVYYTDSKKNILAGSINCVDINRLHSGFGIGGVEQITHFIKGCKECGYIGMFSKDIIDRLNKQKEVKFE